MQRKEYDREKKREENGKEVSAGTAQKKTEKNERAILEFIMAPV